MAENFARSSGVPPAAVFALVAALQHDGASLDGAVHLLASVIGCDMLCRSPYVKGDLTAYPCGQCLPCRLNRRRLWTHRMMLESLLHSSSSFVTLTYSEENLPSGGTLVPRHTTLWLKRLRKAISPLKLRYFLVGEYGDQTARPHYHAAIFGIGPEWQATFQQAWTAGFVSVGDLTLQSAQYVAGYVTKKMTKPDDPRLSGRHPEFARMSLRPGIGADAMQTVAEHLFDRHGARLIARDGDVPLVLQHGRRKLPLGRYLRRLLREQMGFETSGGQAKPQQQRYDEMQALREASGLPARSFKVAKPFIEWERIRQVETRAQIWAKKEKL